MHRRLFDSVRVRLTILVTVVFAAGLSIAAFGLVFQVERALINDIRTRNDNVVQGLGQLFATGEITQTSFDTSVLESQLGAEFDPDVVREAINQSVVYISGTGTVGVADRPSLLDRLKLALSGEAVPLFGKELPAQVDETRYVMSDVTVDTPSGEVVLSMASSLSPVQNTTQRVANSMLFGVPSLVVAVGILAWFMTGRALKPVSAITKQVQEITGSTLLLRVPEPDTHDEIGELATTMNGMLDRLERSAENQKKFLSDASHELRSPVAAIRAQLETALLHPDSTDWNQVGKTVLREDERLGFLVDNLLAMSRLEEGVRRPAAEVDLDEIIFDQLDSNDAITVDCSAVLAGRVMGVPDEITSVVRNLYDNAMHHAVSKIRISLDTFGHTVRFSVGDDGPGVPIEDREKVFERFTRLEESRHRDSGGSGIGLALSKRIVEAHEGRIWVEDSSLGGAEFVVELPSAD